MGYIAYFDLLGTRGFCEDPKVYFDNICKFNNAIKQISWFLKDVGRVGVFSDSAYAESSDLKFLLDFIINVRDRLMSQELFFNAVIKKGNLGITPISNENTLTFGVSLHDSSIADLYITQSNFKGIGIFIDESILDEVKRIDDKEWPYSLNNCIYLSRSIINGTATFSAVEYYDISPTKPLYGKKSENDMLDILLRAFYSSYVKSPKYGAYYISLFSNLLRSHNADFKWDLEKNEFIECPTIFKAIWKMLKSSELSDLFGLDYLAFIFIDEIYNSMGLNLEEKASITKELLQINSLKKYKHSLDAIPKVGLSFNSSLKIHNRDLFIKFCQEDLSTKFAEAIMS